MHTIFYVDITEEALPAAFASKLPIYRVARQIPYEEGGLQIYCGHVPREVVQAGMPREALQEKLPREALQEKGPSQNAVFWKRLFRRRVKSNRKQLLPELLSRAEEMLSLKDRDAILFSPELSYLTGTPNRVPEACYRACLFARYHEKQRKADIPRTVSITIPEDTPSLLGESICRMLRPYLSKVNYVVFTGERTKAALWAERYFYEEYGILSSFEKKPAKNSLWLDFEKERATAHKRYASENGIYHLNEAEVLKFLDTITKNGYNTEVN